MDHRDVDYRFGGVGFAFVVLAQPAPSSQPAKGPLHNPALALHLEALGSWSWFDDVEAFSELLPNPIDQLTSIATVGPNYFNSAVALKNSGQKGRSSVPILHVGGGDHDHQHQTQRVHDQMAFGAVDFLSSIVASGFIPLGAFDRLAVQDGRTGFDLPSFGQPKLSVQTLMQGDPETVQDPVPVIGVKGRPGREVLGDVAPLATGADDVENAIEDLPVRQGARAARLGLCFKEGFNKFPLMLCQIGGVTSFFHPPSIARSDGQPLSI